MKTGLTASMAESSKQASFTSDRGFNSRCGHMIDLCEKSQSTFCRKSWVFSGYSGFLTQGQGGVGFAEGLCSKRRICLHRLGSE